MATVMGTGAVQTRQPGLGAAWRNPASSLGQKCWRVSPPAFFLAQLPGEEGVFVSESSAGSDPQCSSCCVGIPFTFKPPLLNLLWLLSQPPGDFLAEHIIHHCPARLMQALVLCSGVSTTFTLISCI